MRQNLKFLAHFEHSPDMPGALPINAVHNARVPWGPRIGSPSTDQLFVLHHHFQLLLVASELREHFRMRR